MPELLWLTEPELLRLTEPELLREPEEVPLDTELPEELRLTEPELARDVVLPTEERDTLLAPDLLDVRTDVPA